MAHAARTLAVILGWAVGTMVVPAEGSITVDPTRPDVIDTGNGDPTDGLALDLVAGNSGPGALTLDGSTLPSTLEVQNRLQVGVGTGASGTLTLSGGGQLCTASAAATAAGSPGVCTATPGPPTIADSPELENAVVLLGRDPGSTGAVTVTGPSSRWTSHAKVFVGVGGSGTLSVLAGGTVISNAMRIARLPGSVGKATVDGLGSTLEISLGQLDTPQGNPVFDNTLDIGRKSTGTLTVRNGGKVLIKGQHLPETDPQSAGAFLSIGREGGGDGFVSVTGTGSGMQLLGPTPKMFVGAFVRVFGEGSGTGRLNIFDGGQVVLTSSNGLGKGAIARDEDSNGTVIVSGIEGTAGCTPSDPCASLLEVPRILTLAIQNDEVTEITNGTAEVTVKTGGTLRVDPDGSGEIRIGRNGTLRGCGGQIEANVTTGGTTTAGCSTGTLAILGQYTGRPGSEIILKIDANGAHDLLDVRDGLVLDPASQLAILVDPMLRVTPGQSYPLIQSNTGANLTVVGTTTGGLAIRSSAEFTPLAPVIRLEPVTTFRTEPLTVPIDIKPGNSPNSINLGAAGVVPVAILSSSVLDATQVDPSTVTLASAPVRLIGKSGKYSCGAADVNGDGLLDLVCHVETNGLQLVPGASMAELTAYTFFGQAIKGVDSIVIVSQ